MADESSVNTYTVTQAAKIVGKSPNSIRGYSNNFGQYLSEYATPDEGQERQFTDADIEVLTTISTLYSQRKKKKDIVAALARGDVHAPAAEPIIDAASEATETLQEPSKGESATQVSQDRALATLELLQQYAKPYIERASELEERLDEERGARLLAEVDAAQLRGKLEAIEGRKPWWRFWGD